MAEWFRHDMDALLDAKIQELVTRCGMAGYGLYWTIVERMYRNNGAVAGADLALLERLTGTAHKTFLRYLQAFVEIGLFSSNNGEYHSPRIDMELDRVKELNAKRAEGAKKRQDDLRQAVDKHCSSTGCAVASDTAQALDDHCLSLIHI